MTVASGNLDAIQTARDRSLFFESSIDPAQQKKLGQYFTGLRLGRLLAVLSASPSCRSVIDPMSGIGDLLDATLERCSLAGYKLERVDAIEIDQEVAAQCAARLSPWQKLCPNCAVTVHATNAFTAALWRNLQPGGYDLAITNPPYVRYQTLAQNGRDQADKNPTDVRHSLLQTVRDCIPTLEQHIWNALVSAYSGHSDLSVPCWLLAGMFVKPGGTLAVVAPAAWRSRNYANVLRYMLARCFEIKMIVADKQPGWFSQALVRTHLVIAQRLPTTEVLLPLRLRSPSNKAYPWVEIAPSAKKGESLLGNLFVDSVDPEGEFSAWLRSQTAAGSATPIPGVSINYQNLDNERDAILSQDIGSAGLKKLEPVDSALFAVNRARGRLAPAVLVDLLPDLAAIDLLELGSSGISVSQGLRTGCNAFFYVEFVKQVDPAHARIRVHRQLGGAELVVPTDVLRVVVRRQSELGSFLRGENVRGRVLDLRMYALPEDNAQAVQHALLDQLSYKAMPDNLAMLVRRAAKTVLATADSRRIPELSAVATNIRPTGGGPEGVLPRFWYMLPDFTRRHTPDVFVARINHTAPWVMINRQPPPVIDANFSTLWSDEEHWSPAAIAGLLNSSWARVCMEAIGTPMGGGALKLEATHLRRLPIPRMSHATIHQLGALRQSTGAQPLAAGTEQDEIDLLISRALLPSIRDDNIHREYIQKLRNVASTLQTTRKRTET